MAAGTSGNLLPGLEVGASRNLLLGLEDVARGGKPGRGEGERKGVLGILEVVEFLLAESSTLLVVEERVGLA